MGTENWKDAAPTLNSGEMVCWMPKREFTSRALLAPVRFVPATVTISPRAAAGWSLGGLTSVSVGEGLTRLGWARTLRRSTGRAAVVCRCGCISTTDTC